jgi:flavin reductase
MTESARLSGEAESAPDSLRSLFRDAMSQHACGVTLVTTDGDGGKAGFAATAVCSLSDRVPSLLVCVNRASSAHAAIHTNKVACVNILGEEDREISSLFGGKTPMDERFRAGRWASCANGSPTLSSAIVSIECVLIQVHDGVSHDILIYRVTDIRQRGGKPLVYFNRLYRQLS